MTRKKRVVLILDWLDGSKSIKYIFMYSILANIHIIGKMHIYFKHSIAYYLCALMFAIAYKIRFYENKLDDEW